MSKIVVDYGNSASGGNIPFELAPYQSRVTISSQNCYLFNDNGTAKAHITISFTATTSIAANAASLMNVPLQTNLNRSVTIDGASYTLIGENGASYLRKVGAISSGQTLNLDFDYEL